jgi:protein TonB
VSDLSLQKKPKPSNSKKYATMAVVVLVVFSLIGWGLYSLLGGKKGAKPKAPKISLIPTAPPPPPPPPPKLEKKPPEPPKDQKEIKIDQPVPKVEAPAPSPELKMDGPAGNGPSAFASGAITSEDLSKIGNGKGPLGNPFNVYAGVLRTDLQRTLSKHSDLRRRVYRVEIHLWINPDGSIKRSELVGGTGDESTDAAIREALKNAPSFTEGPPANMPQPVRLRINSTGRA